jgi:hypothetical protein
MRQALLAAAILLGLAAAPRSAGAQVSGAAVPSDSVTAALRAFGLSREGIELNGRFVRGNTVVASGDSVAGPVVTVQGDADIRGYVAGGVLALWGDVTVHPGADVVGGVTAYHGRVVIDGGRVRGALQASPAAAAPPAAPPVTTGRAISLALGWTGMMVLVGLLVLVVANANLEATARALEQDFGRSFFVGVMGQFGFLPLVLLLVVLLAVTILGVLLIPFALVAAPIAFAGLVTLGWVALALVCGRAILRSGEGSGSRAEAIRALLLGVVLLMAPWILAATLHATGTLALIARVVALGVTWVAGTAGLGATLLSRAGSRPRRDSAPQAPIQGWATPTPISGVAAARRPIPARPGATPK